MLDALSDALARQIFETLAADRSHARADLDRLPPLAAHALRQRLDREAGSRLDRAAPWLSRTPEAWREDALAGARFPADAWHPAVRETCHALLAALVMPSEALPQQLVPADATATAPDVLDGLKALGAYPYLVEIVRRYVDKKGLETFGREELGHLISRIDRRVASELDTDGWMALLTPLYDIVGGIPEQEGDVPGRVLAEAFSARGCPGLGREVVSETDLSRDALRGILDRALQGRAPEPLAPTPPEALPVVPEIHSTSEPIAAEPADIEDADLIEPLAPEADAAESDEPATPEADVPSPSEFLAALLDGDEAQDETESRPNSTSGYTVEALVVSSGDEPSETLHDAPAPEAEASPDLPPASGDPLDAPIASLEDEPEVDLVPEPPQETPDVETEPESETLLDRLARQSGQTLSTQTSPTATPLAAPAPATDPLWKRFENGSTPEAPRPAHTLHDAMRAPAPDAPLEVHEADVLGDAASNREWYTEHLFNGDGDAYARVLAQLSAARSWTAATQVISREIFRRYKVNIYSEPAVSFTEAVRLRRD